MGDKTEAFDIFQTPLSSHYPLPLMWKHMGEIKIIGCLHNCSLILSNTVLECSPTLQ
jgi:hypothetical protein